MERPDKPTGRGLKIMKHAQGQRIMFEGEQLCMPHSITRTEDQILDGKLLVDDSPVTYSCAANAHIDPDGLGNRMFNKKKSRGRIDGMVTIAMAVGAATAAAKPRRNRSTHRAACGEFEEGVCPMSPDDYRARANYRRSEAPRQQRLGGGVAVQAFTAMDIDSPVLREFMGIGRTSAAGVTVSERVALRNSGFPCHQAHLDLDRYVADPPDAPHCRWPHAKAKDHPLYRLLHKRPNGYQTALEFKAHMQLCALLDGNAYARVVWG